MLRFTKATLLLVLACGVAAAQAPDLKITRVGPDQGLPGVTVTNVVEDPDGFYWIETWAGLFKHDGYSFEAYSHDPANPNSVSANWIAGIAIDSVGRYWIGTMGGGLNLFDPVRETFEHYRHDPADPASISSDDLQRVLVAADGTVWVLSADGLNRISAPGRFDRFYHDPDDDGSLSGSSIAIMVEDANGRFWVGAGNPWNPLNRGGLSHFDPATGRSTNYYIEPDDPTNRVNYVQHILIEHDGSLLVAGWAGGLYRFDPKVALFEKIETPTPPYDIARQGRHHGITSMVREPGSDVIWMASYGGGLMRYDASTGDWATYLSEAGNPNSLSDNKVWNLMLDDGGTLWIGTTGGLNKTPIIGKLAFVSTDGWGGRPGDWIVDALEYDGKVWLTTSSMALVGWDRQPGKSRTYRPDSRCDDAWGFQGAAVAPSSRGGLWFLDDCGLYAFDPDPGKFDLLTDDLASDSPAADHTVRMLEDSYGQLWISSEPGVVRIDPASGIATRYRPVNGDPTSLSDDDVDSIFLSEAGEMWIGTADGANRYDPASDSFDRFLVDGTSPPAVTDMLDSGDGRIWMSTDQEGIVLLDPSDGSFENVTVVDGLHTNTITKIEADRNGSIWVLSRTGASVYDPESGTARRFDGTDGVIDITFGQHAMQLLSSGEMFIGGSGGANLFDPSEHKPRLEPPAVVLTQLMVGGAVQVPQPGGVLEEKLADTSTIRLAHDQNDVTIDFVALGTEEPKLTRYQHRLDGVDTDWQPAGGQRSVRYSSLQPGAYLLKVRASTGNGGWSPAVSLGIVVESPWWATPWAFLLCALCAAGLVLVVVRSQTQRAIREERSQAAARLAELRSQFFANISHELRTPLTLILGEIEGLKSVVVGEQARKLEVADRNGRRLLLLINQLLDLAKLEARQMDLRAAEQDLVGFAKSVTYSFESLAEQRGLDLRFESPVDDLAVFFERDKLEKVFYNLLSNAFKFTESGGVTVKVAQDAESSVHVNVADTGVGIEPDRLGRIFDRFYQVGEHRAETPGTGIGLALARELVELHGGTLTADSTRGAGSTFTVTLPTGRDHLSDAQIASQSFAGDGLSPFLDAGFHPNPVGSEPQTIKDGDTVVLIVEDNNDIRSYIREQLPGYSVLEAADGALGLERARDVIPELIISDVMMPEMDGTEMVERLRADERTSHIPIIMLTARAGEEDLLGGLEAGVDAYLTKPFRSKELRLRVSKLIEQRRMLRERFREATVFKPSDVAVTSVDKYFIERVINEIEARMGEDAFGAQALAEAVGMSTSQLNRKLNALVDQPAGKLIRSMRLQRAADLIVAGSGTFAEIAYAVGFGSQAQFSTAFRKHFGVTPSAYHSVGEQRSLDP